ncbi:uncharacterized protein EV422DRAFT_390526 [Fimicolochytrium jonesii]|uniref:uncharacterized protein n=1 Tax=Fimicolochytrium jonesii TaxID=1396493 RepID=UPI0022FEDF00|nr:uncharacterized protein EV422DRAFT_390526 [Fimicolochytrium jonesii]KAI8823063.1 hypothetical protein EV422DRAFT_390526 [Fimicolochytrium jonesii]
MRVTHNSTHPTPCKIALVEPIGRIHLGLFAAVIPANMQKPSSPMDILHAEVCAGDPAAAFYGAEFAVYQHANTVQRPHGGGLVSQGSGGSKFPKKREQVKNACVNCQKACKKCDDIRPCPRCVKYNMSSRCYDSARKQRKKGFRRGSNDGINSSGTSSPYSLMAMAAELPPSLSYQNRGMPQGLGPFTAYGPGPHYDGIEHHRRQSEWDKLNVLANVCTAVLDQDHSSPDSPIIPYEPSSHGSLSSDDDHMYRIGNRSRPMRFDKAPWGAEPASRRNSADSNAYSVSQRRGSGLASSFSSGSPNGINEDSDSPLTRWESPAQNASPVRAGSSTYMT